MQAAVVNVLGQAPKCQTFPDPVAGDGEAIIQVRAAGLPPILKALAAGRLKLDAEPVPLAEGGAAWNRADKGRRIVFTV